MAARRSRTRSTAGGAGVRLRVAEMGATTPRDRFFRGTVSHISASKLGQSQAGTSNEDGRAACFFPMPDRRGSGQVCSVPDGAAFPERRAIGAAMRTPHTPTALLALVFTALA